MKLTKSERKVIREVAEINWLKNLPINRQTLIALLDMADQCDLLEKHMKEIKGFCKNHSYCSCSAKMRQIAKQALLKVSIEKLKKREG